MSLLPLLFSNWWEDLEHPHRIPAQHFAVEVGPDHLQELPMPSLHRFYNNPLQAFRNYYSPRRSGIRIEHGSSIVKPDKDRFHVSLDIQQFSPEEIKVKVVDNYVVVEGKHDEKPDEHGYVMRQFIRKYLIPQQCDVDKVSSTLSSDGILTLMAPRKVQEEGEKKERIISIEHTGKPAIIFAGKKSLGLAEKMQSGENCTEGKEADDEAMKNGNEDE